MASEHANIVPSNKSPPDRNPNPPGQGQNIESTLQQLNTNMGTLTQLLTEVWARLPTRDANARREGSSSSQNPLSTGQNSVQFYCPLMSPPNIRGRFH